MANRTVRLYTFTAAVVLFLAAWVTIASRPWLNDTAAATPEPPAPSAQPNVQLQEQQQRVARKTAQLERLLANLQNAPAPSTVAPQAAQPRIVQTPPVTRSRSS